MQSKGGFAARGLCHNSVDPCDVPMRLQEDFRISIVWHLLPTNRLSIVTHDHHWRHFCGVPPCRSYRLACLHRRSTRHGARARLAIGERSADNGSDARRNAGWNYPGPTPWGSCGAVILVGRAGRRAPALGRPRWPRRSFGPSAGFLLAFAPAAFVSGLVMAKLKASPVFAAALAASITGGIVVEYDCGTLAPRAMSRKSLPQALVTVAIDRQPLMMQPSTITAMLPRDANKMPDQLAVTCDNDEVNWKYI